MVCYLSDIYVYYTFSPVPISLKLYTIMETGSSCSVMSKLIPVPELDPAQYVP